MTLVPRKGDCLVTDVENGDKTQEHYGLAVDYGSTTILMQAVGHGNRADSGRGK